MIQQFLVLAQLVDQQLVMVSMQVLSLIRLVLSGYGINGADFIVNFELELPDEIPKEYEKEFSALLDKICISHNTVDLKQLDPAEINILDKCESESENEDEEQPDEDNSHHVPSCAQQ